MSSLVLYRADLKGGLTVVAAWNKLEDNVGRQYTVNLLGQPRTESGIAPLRAPTRYFASANRAVRAAKRTANQYGLKP